MNVNIKVNPSQEQAFLKLLESLTEMGIIEHFEVDSTEKGKFERQRLSKKAKGDATLSTKEYIDQYRDLVD